MDAIERLLVSHPVPGDKVAVENPCFLSSINTLRSAGMAAIGVAMDDEGMLPRALEAALEKAREGGADHAARAIPPVAA